MLTAEQAALQLGVSKRTMYDLAAPKGPIPCVRYTARCMRFDEQDLEDYKKSCLYHSIKLEVAGSLTSTRLSTDKESGLLKCFQQAGAKPRLKPLASKKHLASMA